LFLGVDSGPYSVADRQEKPFVDQALQKFLLLFREFDFHILWATGGAWPSSARPHRFSLCENRQTFAPDVAVLNGGKFAAVQRLNSYGNQIAFIFECLTLDVFTTLKVSNGSAYGFGDGKKAACLYLAQKKILQ